MSPRVNEVVEYAVINASTYAIVSGHMARPYAYTVIMTETRGVVDVATDPVSDRPTMDALILVRDGLFARRRET